MFGCVPVSPNHQEIRKITLKHSRIITTSPPTPPLAARIWFAAAALLALILLGVWFCLTPPVVLPGAEVVPTRGEVVILGGIIVLLALGTAVELFWVTEEVVYTF